jgi:hypothetical protein
LVNICKVNIGKVNIGKVNIGKANIVKVNIGKDWSLFFLFCLNVDNIVGTLAFISCGEPIFPAG